MNENLSIKKLLVVFLFGIMFIGFIQVTGQLIQEVEVNTDDMVIRGEDNFVVINSKELSEKEKACSSCFEDDKCYPFGYRKEGKFCTEIISYYYKKYKIEVVGWDNQSNTGANCTNSFECKTNFCSQNRCINQSEEISKGVEEELNRIKENAFDKIEAQIEELNESKPYLLEVQDKKIPVQKNIIEIIYKWFKEILS